MAEYLKVGDKVPDFTVPCVWGKEFTLSSQVRESPAAFYFYPLNYGMQCTAYSMLMNDYFEGFDAIGVQMFHVNNATVDDHRKYMGRVSTRYDHLADNEYVVADIFGMVLPSPMRNNPPLTNRGFAMVDTDMTLQYIWRAPSTINTLEFEPLIDDLYNILRARHC
ncbi:MAG: peroxiredoxin family protein [Methanomassiliicoccaceae archaeon]|nr:peroxiredoxin family protein [Methanomassiliicoccaceae archaeon]